MHGRQQLEEAGYTAAPTCHACCQDFGGGPGHALDEQLDAALVVSVRRGGNGVESRFRVPHLDLHELPWDVVSLRQRTDVHHQRLELRIPTPYTLQMVR